MGDVIEYLAGLPGLEKVNQQMEIARDTKQPYLERGRACSYLTGQARVLFTVGKHAQAEYLVNFIRRVRSTFDSGVPHASPTDNPRELPPAA